MSALRPLYSSTASGYVPSGTDCIADGTGWSSSNWVISREAEFVRRGSGRYTKCDIADIRLTGHEIIRWIDAFQIVAELNRLVLIPCGIDQAQIAGIHSRDDGKA
ncbi:MAG: hypothetical protein J7455_01205 [Roseiflexus sp.]|jgi:hypothetical protein|nr:hypothetical protein [Roseiflexus sp.]MBO9365123.1 hypothetical protein [Roseiflexus sp.]MBO9382039.1 hypothetical protein [Roseiflexus sp.]MBO9387910.1 hypothetical protein [Roseiflexus sp.]